MSTSYERVQRGVRYLDKTTPGWEDRIDRPIDLSNNKDCVIGQVHGDFIKFINKKFHLLGYVGYCALGLFVALPWALRHGFALTEDAPTWEDVVAERKAAKRAVVHAENIVTAEYIRARSEEMLNV